VAGLLVIAATPIPTPAVSERSAEADAPGLRSSAGWTPQLEADGSLVRLLAETASSGRHGHIMLDLARDMRQTVDALEKCGLSLFRGFQRSLML
jgi:hypothetical protein